MPLILDTSDRSFSYDTKSLGTVVFYRLNVKDWLKLADQTENPDDLSAKQVVTKLISFAAHRKTGDSAPARDDEESRLSLEQLGLITDDEWAEISEAYIELHQSSVKVTKTVVEESDSGEQVSRKVVSNAVDLPRGVGEAAIDYLARITKHQLKSTAEHARRLKKLFDQNVYKQFREASTAWSALTDSLSRFKTQGQSAKSIKIEAKPFLDIPRIDQELLRSPFSDIKRHLEEILDHQAKLTPLIVNSANLLGQMYEVGSNVAVDFKRSIKQASTYNKITIIIALSVLGATLVFSCLSYLSSREASRHSSEQMHLLIQEVQRSNNSLTPLKGIQDSNKKIEEMLRAGRESEQRVGRQRQ
jgi:Mg2+ and Co2+ transporter CorA